MSNGSYHLHHRRRLNKKLGLLDKVMYGVAVINPLMLIPQLYVIFAYKEVAGLSVLTWSLLAAINLLWTLYGWVHREMPLFIASAAFACIEFTIVLGILLYR